MNIYIYINMIYITSPAADKVLPLTDIFFRFSSQFIGVTIISTADYSFGFLVLISIVRETEENL